MGISDKVFARLTLQNNRVVEKGWLYRRQLFIEHDLLVSSWRGSRPTLFRWRRLSPPYRSSSPTDRRRADGRLIQSSRRPTTSDAEQWPHLRPLRARTGSEAITSVVDVRRYLRSSPRDAAHFIVAI